MRRWPARLPRWLKLVPSSYLNSYIALTILAICVGLGYKALNDHRAAIRESGAVAVTLATVLAEHADRLIETADLVRTQAAAVALQDGRLTASAELHEALRNIIAKSDHVVSIWIGDENGDAVLTSHSFPTPVLHGAEEDYFKVARDDASGVYIGLLSGTRFADEVLISTSHRLSSEDGGFLGFVQISLSPEYVRNLMTRLDVGYSVTYWLFGPNDRALLRQPLLAVDTLSSVEANDFLGEALSNDSLIAVSPADEVERVFALERSPTHGMLAVVGFPLDEVLGPWRRGLVFDLLAGGVVIIALVLLGMMTNRALRRDRKYANVLEQRVEDRTVELRVLLDEMAHRVMNAFATVQAVHRQTLRGAASLDAYAEGFQQRLTALASANALVLDADSRDAVTVRKLLEVEFAPYAAKDAFMLDGPEVKLRGREAQTLGLVLHELTTNATKYGSLSGSGGRVSVSWAVEGAGGEHRLMLRWVESGGPKVVAPTRTGFGTRLLERSLQPPAGSVAVSYQSTGVRADIDMRIA